HQDHSGETCAPAGAGPRRSSHRRIRQRLSWEPQNGGSSRGRRLRRQQFGLMLGHQRVDDLAECVTFDHLRQLVEREIDAMVTHAPLGKIIGAYALGAVTGADLPSTFGGARSVALLTLEVVEPGAQDRHGLGAVSVLRTILLHHDNDAGRDVGYAYRRFGLVDVLPAGAARAQGVNLQVIVVDVYVDFSRLREHGDSGGRGVGSAGSLGVWHAPGAGGARLRI